MTFDSEYGPFFEPPGWIIGPIWSVLYVMLAISLYTTIVNRSEINYRNIAIALFVIQMIANLMWPSVFDDAKYLQSLFYDCSNGCVNNRLCIPDLWWQQARFNASMALHCVGNFCWNNQCCILPTC